MALTEDTIVDSIDVLPDGQIQVRRANRVFRDGVEISKSYHRHVVRLVMIYLKKILGLPILEP